jgi:hypothetical protein
MDRKWHRNSLESLKTDSETAPFRHFTEGLVL